VEAHRCFLRQKTDSSEIGLLVYIGYGHPSYIRVISAGLRFLAFRAMQAASVVCQPILIFFKDFVGILV
jgi:hypothetical protein